MAFPDLTLLRELVTAYTAPPSGGAGEPIQYFRFETAQFLRHPGLAADPPPVDDHVLWELADAGLLRIDDRAKIWQLTPTPAGRELVEQAERVADLAPVADVASVREAVKRQGQAQSPLAWSAMRPVLLALRRYWELGGYSQHGIRLPALLNVVPDEHEKLFAATIRELIANRYLRATSELQLDGLPVEVSFTARAVEAQPASEVALGAELPALAHVWLSDEQRAALAEPLGDLKDALDEERHAAAVGAAKDLVGDGLPRRPRHAP